MTNEKWILEYTIESDTHEHEVFFSFTDDEGAYAFENWWNSHGHDLFRKHIENNGSEIYDRLERYS